MSLRHPVESRLCKSWSLLKRKIRTQIWYMCHVWRDIFICIHDAFVWVRLIIHIIWHASLICVTLNVCMYVYDCFACVAWGTDFTNADDLCIYTAYTHTRLRACTHTHTYTHIHLYTYTHTHTHKYTQTPLWTKNSDMSSTIHWNPEREKEREKGEREKWRTKETWTHTHIHKCIHTQIHT